MTDETPVPTHCSLCGTELEPKAVGGRPTTPAERASDPFVAAIVGFGDECPNPDCPGRESDMAKAADPQQG